MKRSQLQGKSANGISENAVALGTLQTRMIISQFGEMIVPKIM
jgi:hypothetical protein